MEIKSEDLVKTIRSYSAQFETMPESEYLKACHMTNAVYNNYALLLPQDFRKIEAYDKAREHLKRNNESVMAQISQLGEGDKEMTKDNFLKVRILYSQLIDGLVYR